MLPQAHPAFGSGTMPEQVAPRKSMLPQAKRCARRLKRPVGKSTA